MVDLVKKTGTLDFVRTPPPPPPPPLWIYSIEMFIIIIIYNFP